MSTTNLTCVFYVLKKGFKKWDKSKKSILKRINKITHEIKRTNE